MRKAFHISDVLSVTTGRLVSSRHMDGIYDILNFLTGDDLFTHQLPRANRECQPWVRQSYPQLFPEDPAMHAPIEELDQRMAHTKVVTRDWNREERQSHLKVAIDGWVEKVRRHFGLPEMLELEPVGIDYHERIDPISEAEALVGRERVFAVSVPVESAG